MIEPHEMRLKPMISHLRLTRAMELLGDRSGKQNQYISLLILILVFDIGVLDKLKRFDWKAYQVLYAILFGSIAKKGKGRDIDIAVEFENYNVDLYLKLLNDLQDFLNTELIDLVAITDDTSCYLIHEIFNNTRIIYLRDDNAWFKMNNRINECEDSLIDAKKLNEVENAGLAIMKRWKEGGSA